MVRGMRQAAGKMEPEISAVMWPTLPVDTAPMT